MTLSPDEFIRRFLLHVLPSGFHRIRHYGSIFQSRHEPERRGYLINDSGSDGLGFID
jgi:hypothetical protein